MLTGICVKRDQIGASMVHANLKSFISVNYGYNGIKIAKTFLELYLVRRSHPHRCLVGESSGP